MPSSGERKWQELNMISGVDSTLWNDFVHFHLTICDTESTVRQLKRKYERNERKRNVKCVQIKCEICPVIAVSCELCSGGLSKKWKQEAGDT